MSAQDRTLDHYQELMTINATSHILRAARQLGLLDQLGESQKTVETLSERLQIDQPKVLLLLQSLIAIGIVEQYDEDYALSSTARLLCQYDADLDDATWDRLSSSFRREQTPAPEEPPSPDDSDVQPELRSRFDSIAATQWVHTPAAMQVAEILDLGSASKTEVDGVVVPNAIPQSPIRLLDFGCGSAVWSCAMGYREKTIEITAIDSEAALVAATATATSIGLVDRFQTIVGDMFHTPLSANAFDVAVIAQRLHAFSPTQIDAILHRALQTLKSGGRLVVIDSFIGPNRPTLAESLERLRLQIQTPHGEVPEIKSSEQRLRTAGFDNIQFTFIAASRIGLGLMIGVKP